MWMQSGLSKENMHMGLLDSIVGQCFRDEKAGRVVVFTGDRRNRGYLVKSTDQELKIKAFLKMFFCGHLSIFLLGYFLAYESSMELVYALGRPAAHLFRTSSIFLGNYFLVGLPYLLFWRFYKKALLSFVSAQDEVLLSDKYPRQQRVLLAVGMFAFAIVILLGVILLIRTCIVPKPYK
jgi:hypothetical protein